MRPSFGTNLPQIVTHIWQKAFFKHALERYNDKSKMIVDMDAFTLTDDAAVIIYCGDKCFGEVVVDLEGQDGKLVLKRVGLGKEVPANWERKESDIVYMQRKPQKKQRTRTFLPHTCIAIFFVVCAVLLAGCGNINRTNVFADDGKVHIVCTTFPQYDWVRVLTAGAEEQIELVLLTEGADLHNFLPSAIDIAQVSDCDFLIYVGGESDLWVQDVLREAVNTDMHTFNMMEKIQDLLKEEEHIEGAQEHSHKESIHQQENHNSVLESEKGEMSLEDNTHDESVQVHGFDEHVWLSIRNAERLVEEICVELEQLDIANASLYRKNCNAYLEELETLDNAYCSVFAAPEASPLTPQTMSPASRTLLFADRYPFRYMAEDYGLQCFAAFDGCSAETEASFQTVVFLVEKLNELGLGTVFVIDGSDKRLAEVVIENTNSKNQQIAVLNSMQSVSKKEIANGITYLSIMKDNLEVLRNCKEII